MGVGDPASGVDLSVSVEATSHDMDKSLDNNAVFFEMNGDFCSYNTGEVRII